MISSAILQDYITKLLSDGESYSVQEIKTHLTQNNIIEYSEGQFSGSINTLQRNGTINKIERGIYTLRKNEDDKNLKTCFVISPIGDEKSVIRKNADQLFKHIILPVCKKCNFRADRVDQINDAGSITQNIFDNLENADLVIADITNHNPNVFYEMGYRERTKKPIIHLRKSGEGLPFDIAAIRTLDYDLTDLDSVDSIKDRLEKIIMSFSYISHDDLTNTLDDHVPKNFMASTLPILYQIQNAISDLRDDINNNNTKILETIINSLKNTQPQMSQEDAILAQLIPTMLDNPKMFDQLMEFSKKIPNRQNIYNKRR
ncbi:MAG: nucleoside 2-deoxyribosyltransferase [Defluviitaleaceae bacterium]|nr:nucleoside 2-deoxyribosyltransferase [Defluviitaleaceae bacterium]